MNPTCPTCATPTVPGAAFCDNCGTALSKAISTPPPIILPAPSVGANCPSCGELVMPGEAFCGNCGAQQNQAPLPGMPSSVASSPSYMPSPPAVPPPSYTPSPPSYTPPPRVVPSPSYTPSLPSYSPEPFTSGVTCASCSASLAPGSAFCDTCGAAAQLSMPRDPSWHFVIQGTNQTLPIPANKQVVKIGREDPVSGHFPEVDLGPYGGEEGGVSRHHVTLHIHGHQCFIEDNESVNGTFLNNRRLLTHQREPLHRGDQLRLGRIVLQFFV